ncbi:TetR/AcrR family transcriptional regulator [Roseibium sp.]|uniref:TetR/AcrR family transcriptional regulator n=1 Tax=Roseibium sp. TaxID=1936156 RepID=UPI003A9777B5
MTKTVTSIEPRKLPRQRRAAATVDAVLEASARILEREGLPGFNTNEIARLAGVSIGSLYQYFPTKEAILAEIVRRKRIRLWEGLSAELPHADSQPLTVTIRRLVEATLDHQADNPGLARALDYAYAALPLQGETEDLNAKIIQGIAGILPDDVIPDRITAARDIVAIVRGMVDGATLAGSWRKQDLAPRICRALEGYLGVCE